MYRDDAVQDSLNTLAIFYAIAMQYPYINDLCEKLCRYVRNINVDILVAI